MSQNAGVTAKGPRAHLWIVAWGLFALVLLFALSRGFIAAPQRYLDAKPLYLGGRALIEGVSPYNVEAYTKLWEQVYSEQRPADFIFAYPPTFSVWLLPLGVLPVGVGLPAFDLLNLACLGGIFASLFFIARTTWNSHVRDPRLPFGLLLAAAVGAIPGALLLGQSGLWVVAPLLGLWALPQKTSNWARAVLLLLLTFKPTITLPFLLYFAVLSPGVMAMAVGLSVPVLVLTLILGGGASMIPEWLGAMRAYGEAGANLPTELVSGHSLVHRIAPGLPGNLLTLIGGVIGAALGMKQRAKDEGVPALEHLLILSATVVAFSPIHSYDLVIAIPLAMAIPFASRRHLLWYAPLALVLVRPKLLSVFAVVGVPLSAETTTMLVGICGIGLLFGFLASRLGITSGHANADDSVSTLAR